MILSLFLEFFKIGLFSFGGGYGMIALMQEVCCEKRNWISKEEFVNILAIAESTPGPIAVNLSTYVGYKMAGMKGAIFATAGVCLPSMITIGIISVFFENFLEIKPVAYAFAGIRIAVSILIMDVGIKLFKNELKTTDNKPWTIILFVLFASFIICQNIFEFTFSSIYLIILAALIGLIYHVVTSIIQGKKS
jgi:chromate transporter